MADIDRRRLTMPPGRADGRFCRGGLRFFAAGLITLMAGCASLPPGAHFPKTFSTGFAQPGETTLGREFASAAARNPGLSGFRILNVGVDGLFARIELIDAAQRAIDAQYFIFTNDDSGKLIADAILRAAERGVRVRILVDDAERVRGDEQLTLLRAEPNIEFRFFNPFTYRGDVELFRFAELALNRSRLDHRMHNKLLLVDDAAALVGGRNVGNEYFDVDRGPHFGDVDVFSVGPVVADLSRSFDVYWNSALAIPSESLAPPSAAGLDAYRQELAHHRDERRRDSADFARRIDSGEPLAGLVAGTAPLSWAHAQVLWDSPDKAKVEKGSELGRLLSPVIRGIATQVRSELLMVSPYFVPGQEGMALFASLRQRNVRIRVLTNSLNSTNELAAHAGYMHYRRSLLASGVELYEIRAALGSARGSGESRSETLFSTYALHGKWFVFDRERVFIGSMNFDLRSMHLNTEIGLLIDSPDLATQVAGRFEAMVSLQNSYQVMLLPDPTDPSAHLVWRTEQAGRVVEYSKEPSTSLRRRLEADLLSIFPIDKEL